MAMSDRPSNGMSSTPREMARGDGLSAQTVNRLVDSILRLIIGDGKTISVSYIGGKAVISRVGNPVIPRGGGLGGGDSVVVAATKAALTAPSATAYFTRGWVTGEAGTNYGPWAWNGTTWALVPVTYTTLSDSARPGDFAIYTSRGYMKTSTGAGTDKWVRTTHLGVT